MKITIKLRDKKGNILKDEEITLRDYDHFQSQLKYHSKRQSNKKLFNRSKQKNENKKEFKKYY